MLAMTVPVLTFSSNSIRIDTRNSRWKILRNHFPIENDFIHHSQSVPLITHKCQLAVIATNTPTPASQNGEHPTICTTFHSINVEKRREFLTNTRHRRSCVGCARSVFGRYYDESMLTHLHHCRRCRRDTPGQSAWVCIRMRISPKYYVTVN